MWCVCVRCFTLAEWPSHSCSVVVACWIRSALLQLLWIYLAGLCVVTDVQTVRDNIQGHHVTGIRTGQVQEMLNLK